MHWELKREGESWCEVCWLFGKTECERRASLCKVPLRIT